MFSREEGFIETYTGRRFHPDEPDFNIIDVAHATSNLCRYNGHCKKFYSVAEHSVLTAHIVRAYLGGTEQEAYEALMHDAVEAYVSDVPAPFKQYCLGAVKLEEDLEVALRRHFQLPKEKGPKCKKADLLALFIEAEQLMFSRGRVFSDHMGLKEEAEKLTLYPIVGYNPIEAKGLFLQTYRKLSGGMLL